jgi:hypothetical protein
MGARGLLSPVQKSTHLKIFFPFSFAESAVGWYAQLQLRYAYYFLPAISSKLHQPAYNIMARSDQQPSHKHEKQPLIPQPTYAPLNVPLKRRLQTLAVLIWCSMMSICIFLFFFVCSIPVLFWLPIIIYLTWILIWDKAPENGGRSISWIRNLKAWKLFADYFPAKLIKVREI